MANIAHSLMIKYGLPPGQPSLDLVNAWLMKVKEYVTGGMDGEQAGHLAARNIFPGYQTHKYGSQADTIVALLALLQKK